MVKNLEDFFNDLGLRESSGKADVINNYGYLGLYQMGIPALIDAGYYKMEGNDINNHWESRYFTGKDGINNIDDFLQNPEIQKKAMIAYKEKQWEYLENWGIRKYIGKTINGIKISPSGILAAAHLVGQVRLEKYLSSNGKNIPKDANGTSVEEYLKKFADYDVSEITGILPYVNDEEYPFILYGNIEKYNKKNFLDEIFKQFFPLQNKIKGDIFDEVINDYNVSSHNYNKKNNHKGHWVTIDGNHVFIDE